MPFDLRAFFRFTYRWFTCQSWTPRRAAVAAAYLAVVPPLELLTWCALSLDELLYRGYRRRRVAAPLFITGNPRSGTTFLHRLLTKDRERFTTMRMWEILFAPSITQRRAARALARLDRGLGRPLGRRSQQVEHGWAERNVMHRVSLFAPEEDDYLLLHIWSALTIGLSAGLLDEARPYTYFDAAVPARDRARIMKFYRRCIERHLEARARGRGAGAGRRYLAKNPALCPKLGSLLEAFPDARIVYLVRNPLEVVPSYLSMMRFSWRAVGVPRGREDALRDYVLEMAAHWYRYPLERLARLPRERYAIVRYDDLTRDPRRAVEDLYRHFGLNIDAAFARELDAEAARASRYRSRHEYDLESLGLTRERILAEFDDVFERFDFPRGARPRGRGQSPSAAPSRRGSTPPRSVRPDSP